MKALYRLGKQPAKRDPRTLRLNKYLKLAGAPQSANYTLGATSFGMMANDVLGDCTIAACGHAIQIWSMNLGKEVTMSPAKIIAGYQMWCGYDPTQTQNDGSNPTDQGGVELDVLNCWRANSGLFGHKILAYADPAPGNFEHIKQAIYIFGGVYIGLELPLSAQGQTLWDVTSGPDAAPGSWGGHAVFACAYDPAYVTVITWGVLMKMTWNFWAAYVDEVHALISPDWLNAGQIDPAGVNLQALEEDLVEVAG